MTMQEFSAIGEAFLLILVRLLTFKPDSVRGTLFLFSQLHLLLCVIVTAEEFCLCVFLIVALLLRPDLRCCKFSENSAVMSQKSELTLTCPGLKLQLWLILAMLSSLL